MDDLTKAGPRALLGLLLWKLRHQYPSLAITLTAADVAGLQANLEYQKCEAWVNIVRKPGAVTLLLTKAGTELKDGKTKELVRDAHGNVTMDALVPVENNEGDHRLAEAARRRQAIIDSVPMLIATVQGELRNNTFSDHSIGELITALQTLAKP